MRLSTLTEVLSKYRRFDCYLCVFSEQTADSSAVIFNVIQSTKRQKSLLTEKSFSTLDKDVFWVFITTDSTGIVFNWCLKNKEEAYEVYDRMSEIRHIFNLKSKKKKAKEYRNWIFSLCENKYPTLRYEGFRECMHGNLPSKDVELLARSVMSDEDKKYMLNLVLNADYSSYDWNYIFFHTSEYGDIIKPYVYKFFEYYVNSCSDNIRLQRTMLDSPFNILRNIGADEVILELLNKYFKDEDRCKDYKETVELYINPILARAAELNKMKQE